MSKKTRHFSSARTMVSIVPLLFVVVMLCTRFFSLELYRGLVSEDGILETLQFLLYFVTGCVLLDQLRIVSHHQDKMMVKLALLALAGILFCMSFEEISWGERILKYRNPGYFVVNNVQKEVSVHNLVFIQPYLHASYIVLGLALGLVVPFLANTARLKKLRHLLFGWEMLFYFLPLSLVYLILEFEPPVSLSGLSAYGFIWRDQEVAETLLAAGLLAWAIKAKVVERK